MKRRVIGIDVGGTNIKFGLIDNQGYIFYRTYLSTKSYTRNKNKLINAIIDKIEHIVSKHHLRNSDIEGIGIGLPGIIDPQKGFVKFLPNIPGWRNIPLKEIFEQRLSIPTFLDNDVNLITLGEWQFGAGQGQRNMVCITLGTGVGGGLILNNELYRGAGFAAGEVGHIPINENGPQCNCGGFGCLERYVGNQYILEKVKTLFPQKSFSLEKVSLLADSGDKKAIQLWEEVAVHIGNGLAGVVNLLNPSHIVIGGGVSNSYKGLFPTIRKTVKQRAMKVPAAMVKIVKARLGNDGGIIGSQVLVYEYLKKKMTKLR